MQGSSTFEGSPPSNLSQMSFGPKLPVYINVTFTFYLLALSLSMAAMELSSWMVAALFAVFVFYKASRGEKVEIHPLGIEKPILILIITVAVGLIVNAPNADFIYAIGRLRNLVLLFVMTYVLNYIRNLRVLLNIVLVTATCVAIYGIWQHYTGIDLWRGNARPLAKLPWSERNLYQTIGLFNHHLTYGYSYGMLLCYPLSMLLFHKENSWKQRLFYTFSFLIILTSVIFTYGRGVWIALGVALPVVIWYFRKSLVLVTLAVFILGGYLVAKKNPEISARAESVFSDNYQSNDERKKLWLANMAMFYDHPWLGVGYIQNEQLSNTYYDKLGIQQGMAGHAHSNYVELLATTGFIGFTCFIAIISFFILMTGQLIKVIPAHETFDLSLAISSLGAQVVFHLGGLTQFTFGDTKVQHQFIFWLAVASYLWRKYMHKPFEPLKN